MFPRRGQRLLRRMARSDVSPMVQQANQLIAAGDYQGAADAFKELAQRAESRFPQRAPFLYMAAGNAAILSGQAKIGVAHFKHGLTLFASQGRIHRMRNFGRRAIDELNALNLTAEADEIANLLSGNMPKEISEERPTVPRRPTLPTHCPSCGAAVRPNEIDWLDEVTAECDYCGSPMRGNS
jgi:hypothetical protein